jgi:hypothetical protein
MIMVFPRGEGNKFLGDATYATGIELYPGVGTCRSGNGSINATVVPILSISKSINIYILTRAGCPVHPPMLAPFP